MAAKKGELVVAAPTTGGNLQVDTSVKFEGKITNSDLMDALIFEIEEGLLNDQKALNIKSNNAYKVKTEIQERRNKAFNELSGKFKNKEADKFLKIFNSFLGKKAKLNYTLNGNRTQDGKVKHTMRAQFYDNNYTNFQKDFDYTLPSNIVKLDSEVTTAQKVLEGINSELQAVQTQINELPRLKKRLKAKFVQTMLNGNVNDRKVMFDDLKKELTKHAKA